MKGDDGPPDLVFDFEEHGPGSRDPRPTRGITPLAATPPTTKLLLDVREVGKALGCGKTFVYELIAREELLTVKLGRLTRIPADSLAEFVRRKIESARRADADCWRLQWRRSVECRRAP